MGLAWGAGSGVGLLARPDAGAFWGAGSGAGRGVAAVAPVAAGQLEATRTTKTVPPMRAAIQAAQKPGSVCPRRRCHIALKWVSNAPFHFYTYS